MVEILETHVDCFGKIDLLTNKNEDGKRKIKLLEVELDQVRTVLLAAVLVFLTVIILPSQNVPGLR